MCQPASSASDVDVAALRRRFTELRKRQASAGRLVAMLSVAVVALFGFFTYFTVDRVRNNFNPPAVQKAVADRLPAVVPLAGAHIQKAAVNALPVYRDLAMEEYEKLRPELTAKTMARLDSAADHAEKMMTEQLATSFDKVLKRIEPELNQTFPALTDAQKQELLADYFHDGIEARNQAIASHLETIYTNEMIAVHNALVKFNLPAADEKPIPTEQLQRDFFRSLLALADYELLNEKAEQTDKPAGSSRTASAE